MLEPESLAFVANSLVDAVLPKGGFLLPLINAYFDESGTHDDSPVMAVAGYLFSAENAAFFADRWTAILAQKEIPFFHMVDCAHGNKEFANLSLTERIELAQKLIELIKAQTERGIGAIMPARMYEELMPHHPNMGGAYNYCLWNCLEGVRLWREEKGYAGDVAYFFESGHKSQSEANRIMSQAFCDPEKGRPFGYSAHAFVDKRKFPGVQAADILAWQMCTDWKHGRDGRPRRKDFASLVEQRDHRVQIIDAERILYHVREMTKMGAWNS